MVGEMCGLLVGITVTDGGCDAFTERGTTFPRDIDIASGRNDFGDDNDGDDACLLGNTLLFFAYDVELDGELVFVIVKLGVMFMLACELVRLAAKMSAYPLAELAADVIADGICGKVDFNELLVIFNGAATIPDCICGTVDFAAFGKLLRDCIGLALIFCDKFLFCTFDLG